LINEFLNIDYIEKNSEKIGLSMGILSSNMTLIFESF